MKQIMNITRSNENVLMNNAKTIIMIIRCLMFLQRPKFKQ